MIVHVLNFVCVGSSVGADCVFRIVHRIGVRAAAPIVFDAKMVSLHTVLRSQSDRKSVV